MPKNLFDLPSPKAKILVGNLLDFGQDPLEFLSHCAREYGEIVPLNLGLTTGCFINKPELIHDVLKDKDVFVKSRGVRSLKTLLGQGLLSSEGESWFRQRRLIQPVFHQKRIAGYGKIMVEYTEKMLQTWHDGEVRDVNQEMMRLTLDIVMKCLFSQDISERQAQEVAHALDVAMAWFESKRKRNFLVLEWFPLPENIRYRQVIHQLDQSIYHLIQERRKVEEDTGDLLSMLMAAKDEEDGSQMNDQQLRDEIITLMLAGHETTANTLSWTWMLLSQNPHVQEQLLAELQAVLAGRLPTVEDIPHLRYTNFVIKESMRLYPAVAIMARQVKTACELAGYQIPAGCIMTMSQWVMHRDPHYFEDPETFKPERWENDLEKQLPKGVYFPFGDGPRICIGKGFALMEAVLLLATIAQKFQLKLVPDHPIIPQPSITLRPAKGIQVSLQQR
jgi:cytochrome P450